MDRKTYLEINIDKIYDNYDLFLKKTNKKMIVVVKANAYGTIDYKIASYLQEKGVDMFAVSSLDEAIRLRKHGINEEILIMGYVHDLQAIKDNNLSIIIPTKDYALENANKLNGIKVHIKINTGLNRLGVLPSESKEVLDLLLNSGAKVEGVMTHYACGGDVDYSYQQYYLFKDTVEKLNYDFKYIHSEATDVGLYVENEISNYTRIGLGLFGYSNIESDWNLKEALSLKAEIIACKKVEKGEGVSYGHHYISDGEGYILTAAIGYADGIDKKLENKKVYVDDEECMVVGDVCMDLIMIKSNRPHSVGSEVEIFGEHISITERKKDYETCCCRVITEISGRVTKRYIKNNKTDCEINERI